MKNRHSIRSFLAGALTMLLLVTLAAPVWAAVTKMIEVSTGVTIYVDDVRLNPSDATGKPVEPFIYKGTTYLPVRAVSEALQKPVQWDGGTRSVYIGSHSSSTPAAYLSQMDYFSGTGNPRTAASEKDNTGATHYQCITSNFDRTYLLNGQYTAMDGVLYQKYEMRSSGLRDSRGASLEIYGDGKLLYAQSYEYGTTGIAPEAFHVDLTGVLQLQVKFENAVVLSLGDVALWT